MALPKSLHGNEYYHNLSRLRDEALVNSNMFGVRRRLGKLVVGSATAEWTTGSNGVAVLHDRGIRIGSETLFISQPTTLTFYDTYGKGSMVTEYAMDLDGVNGINGHTFMLTNGGLRDAALAHRARYADRHHDLTEPTDQNLIRIYNEMERGASGEHRLYATFVDGATE